MNTDTNTPQDPQCNPSNEPECNPHQDPPTPDAPSTTGDPDAYQKQTPERQADQLMGSVNMINGTAVVTVEITLQVKVGRWSPHHTLAQAISAGTKEAVQNVRDLIANPRNHADVKLVGVNSASVTLAAKVQP